MFPVMMEGEGRGETRMNTLLTILQCDEIRPACARCSTKNLSCQYEFGIMSMLPKFSRHQINNQKLGLSSVPHSLGLGLDLSSLQLMHHFDHCTAPTLAFGSAVWRDGVLPLALHVCYTAPLSCDRALLTLLRTKLSCMPS